LYSHGEALGDRSPPIVMRQCPTSLIVSLATTLVAGHRPPPMFCSACRRLSAPLPRAVTDHLATGRPVRATKLGRLLPDFRDFVLRPQPREVYVVDRAGCHNGA